MKRKLLMALMAFLPVVVTGCALFYPTKAYRGVFVTEDGEPLPDAQIAPGAIGVSFPYYGLGVGLRGTKTDDEGRFSIRTHHNLSYVRGYYPHARKWDMNVGDVFYEGLWTTSAGPEKAHEPTEPITVVGEKRILEEVPPIPEALIPPSEREP